MPVKIKSLRVSIEALQKGSKTSVGLTAPIPSVMFAFDQGWERAIFGLKASWWKGVDIKVYDYDPKGVKPSQDLWRGHEISIFLLPRPPQTDVIRKQGCLELWNYFNALIGLAARDTEYLNSAIVDTMTLARRIRADAKLEALQARPRPGQPMRESLIEIEYGDVNDAIRDIYINFESTGINLVALHHLADERKDMPETDNRGNVTFKNVKTGDYILEGYGKTYQAIDLAIRTSIVSDPKGGSYNQATFMESGYNPDLKGTIIRDVTWNSLMTWVEVSLGGNVEFPKSKIPVAE